MGKPYTSVIKVSGYTACRILFYMIYKVQINEKDVTNLLSELLLKNRTLNNQFINVVENVYLRAIIWEPHLP